MSCPECARMLAMTAENISQLIHDCRGPLLKENARLRERIEELENRLIAAWHFSNPTPGTLASFLAFTDEEFAVWVRTTFKIPSDLVLEPKP